MESGEPLGPAPQCPLAHDGRQMLSMTVPIGVDDLFTILFTNSSFFMDFLQTTRKSTGSCPRYLLLVDFVFNLSVVLLQICSLASGKKRNTTRPKRCELSPLICPSMESTLESKRRAPLRHR